MYECINRMSGAEEPKYDPGIETQGDAVVFSKDYRDVDIKALAMSKEDRRRNAHSNSCGLTPIKAIYPGSTKSFN